MVVHLLALQKLAHVGESGMKPGQILKRIAFLKSDLPDPFGILPGGLYLGAYHSNRDEAVLLQRKGSICVWWYSTGNVTSYWEVVE